MTEFLLMFHCAVSFASPPTYTNGAYNGTIQVICDKSLVSKAYHSEVHNDGALKEAMFDVAVLDKVVVTSKVVVNRPWIAPQPLFMQIAEKKHKDTVLAEIYRLYKENK